MVSLFVLLGCNLSYIVDLFAAFHELASASARTLLKLASSVRALLKPYGDTLRTVPTFVNAHTFCASRKPWFRHYARAWVDNDAINYAIKYTTKMKANFFYRDYIKFNEPVLKPGTPE